LESSHACDEPLSFMSEFHGHHQLQEISPAVRPLSSCTSSIGVQTDPHSWKMPCDNVIGILAAPALRIGEGVNPAGCDEWPLLIGSPPGLTRRPCPKLKLPRGTDVVDEDLSNLVQDGAADEAASWPEVEQCQTLASPSQIGDYMLSVPTSPLMPMSILSIMPRAACVLPINTPVHVEISKKKWDKLRIPTGSVLKASCRELDAAASHHIWETTSESAPSNSGDDFSQTSTVHCQLSCCRPGHC